MKKKMFIITMAACFFASSTLAAAGSRTVNATITNLKLYFNENRINGTVLNYNNTNYVPVNILNKYLGYKVSSDSEGITIIQSKDKAALLKENSKLSSENADLKAKLRLYSGGEEDYTGQSKEDYFNSLTKATSLAWAAWPLTKNEFIKTPREASDDTWYKFSLKEGEGLTVALKAQIDTGTLGLSLLNEDQEQLDSCQVANGSYGTVHYQASCDTVIYVKVTGGKGLYYLGFYEDYSNNEDSGNDKRDFFGSIYTAKKLAAAFYTREEEALPDYYRMEVGESQQLNVVIMPKMDDGNMRLALYGSKGEMLKSVYVMDSQTGYVSIKAPKKSTYYISVTGSEGTYYLEYYQGD